VGLGRVLGSLEGLLGRRERVAIDGERRRTARWGAEADRQMGLRVMRRSAGWVGIDGRADFANIDRIRRPEMGLVVTIGGRQEEVGTYLGFAVDQLT